jgi:hypothetical protein
MARGGARPGAGRPAGKKRQHFPSVDACARPRAGRLGKSKAVARYYHTVHNPFGDGERLPIQVRCDTTRRRSASALVCWVKKPIDAGPKMPPVRLPQVVFLLYQKGRDSRIFQAPATADRLRHRHRLSAAMATEASVLPPSTASTSAGGGSSAASERNTRTWEQDQ